ncbi:hypothetical protein AB0876_28595 [Mycobacterium sp. NPDC049093]
MPDIGDLVPTTDDRWMTLPPKRCPNGHQLGGHRVLVGHQPCNCGGHTTWRCRECDAVIYGPPLSAGCRPLAGPATVVEL